MNDYYSLLGVRRDASNSEITMVYRRILKEKFQEAGYSFLFSNITQAYRTLSNSEKRKDYDLLLQRVVGKYILQNPNNPTPADKKYQSGLNAMDQKNFQSAVDFFTQAIKADPEKSHFYSQLGMALGMFNGRLAEAERYCKKAIELEPDNPELCYNLGFLYQRHNLVDAAQQAFLQAQEAEQRRWENVFKQSAAAIELGWKEDLPMGEPESLEAETVPIMEETSDEAAEGIGEKTSLLESETEILPIIDEPAADIEEELKEPVPEYTGNEEIVEDRADSGKQAEVKSDEPEETDLIDDFAEPIILNDSPSESISQNEEEEDLISEFPATTVLPYKISIEERYEPEIDAGGQRAEASGDQVIMAEIIEGDDENVVSEETGQTPVVQESPEVAAENRSIVANPQDTEMTPNPADESDREVSPAPEPVEMVMTQEETAKTDIMADAVSSVIVKPEEDDILKDLASLEAELAEVEASSGIGSGDNGLLMEMKTQQEMVNYPSNDIAGADKPWLSSENNPVQESSSLDDLEDEALNLLRELGLSPSSHDPAESEDMPAADNAAEEQPSENSDQSQDESSVAGEAEGEHEDLEELEKLEEMERKMAEELERLKQQREKLKKKAKK